MATKKRHFKFKTVGTILQILEPMEDGGILEGFNANRLPANVVEWLTMYGLKQKLADTVSDVEDTDGKLEGMRAMFDRLMQGETSMERSSGSRQVAAWIEAVAELKGVSIAAVQATLKSYTEAQKKKLRESDKVKAKTAAIEEQRKNATSVDMDDLLDDEE